MRRSWWLGAGMLSTVGIVAVAAPPAAAPARYAQMTDAQVTEQLAAAQKVTPVGTRIQAVTDPFLGTPYLLGNMGEGPDGDGRDKDPRYNVASVDCTTFVEHALAFSASASVDEARRRLDAIRYAHGRVNYGTRRHWPEAQWVPGLVEEGYLEDVTAQVAGRGGKLEQAEVVIDLEKFKASAHAASMPLADDEVPRGKFTIPVLPLDDLKGARDRLEAGLVINIVKAPKDGVLVRISHQGLVARKGKAVFIRHASSIGPKAVIDEPLDEFVRRQKAAKGWPTVGFNFLRAREHFPALPVR